MKRFHVHVAVDDLAASTKFYAGLFGAPPSVAKPDYAKWMLDDPRVNFAISVRGRAAGLDHLGIQVDGVEELGAVHARLEAAGEAVREKGESVCCYAKSDKGWVTDPQGISWETFFTHGESTAYGEGLVAPEQAGACCGPAAAKSVADAKPAAACCGAVA